MQVEKILAGEKVTSDTIITAKEFRLIHGICKFYEGFPKDKDHEYLRTLYRNGQKDKARYYVIWGRIDTLNKEMLYEEIRRFCFKQACKEWRKNGNSIPKYKSYGNTITYSERWFIKNWDNLSESDLLKMYLKGQPFEAKT